MDTALRITRGWAYVSVALGVVLYSSAAVFIQASSLAPIEFTFWRLGAGVLVFVVLALVTPFLSPRDLLQLRSPILLVAGVSFGLQQLTIAVAIKGTTVVSVTLLNGLSPLVVGLMLSRLRIDASSRASKVGVLIAILGAALGSAEGFRFADSPTVSLLAAVVSVVSFALFTVTARLARSSGMETLPFIGGSTVVAALMVAMFAAVTGGIPSAPDGVNVVLVVATAIGPGVLGHFAMTWPLDRMSLMVPTAARLLVPFVAGALALVFVGEPLTAPAVVGMLLTALGVGSVFYQSYRVTTP